MSSPIHAFSYLSDSPAPAPVCVVFGDDRFLKRMVLDQLSRGAGGQDEQERFTIVQDGNTAQWRDIADELVTVSLFGDDRRFVVVEQADKFVSCCRASLEAYVARPSSTSVLVLDVATWPSNTRLYKEVGKVGLAIECGPPQRVAGKRKAIDESALADWLCRRGADHHRAKMTRQAALQLIELVGHDLGVLDQQLAKLALLVDPKERVTPEMVGDIVGGWRAKTTWELLDAATDGNAAEALKQLDRILHSGEPPIAIFGAISWSLRRFADAARVVQQAEREGRRIDLPGALLEAGFRKWPQNALETAERQLRQIGRERAGRLYRWLLEADLELKGTHSAPDRARFVLERLIVRLARQARPPTPRVPSR
jgi:DNA polymerase-3 subunit delta